MTIQWRQAQLSQGLSPVLSFYWPLVALSLLLAGSLLLALSKGAIVLSAEQVWQALWRGPAASQYDPQALILWQLRLPRVLMAALIGAALAVSGAAVQAVFRNPLADPGLIGVSSGAALAAIIMIVLGPVLFAGYWGLRMQLYALPLAAFVGGLLTTFLVYAMASLGGQTRVTMLLLAGIAIAALTGAISGVLTYLADDTQLRGLTFWSMGSLAGITWPMFYATAPWLLLATLLLPCCYAGLNALLLGENVASHLGVNAQWLKRGVIVLAALAVGASVAAAGMIGFIGLVVPHIMRLWLGPDHQRLLPASALAGASLLVLADLAARTLIAPAEVPIGIITALVGSPFFILLLLQQAKRSHFT